jgi:hypothetical protein
VAKKVDVDDVSAADIAERLGLPHRSLAHGWVKRFSDFPKPVVELGIGKVWSWREVERWAANSGPRGTRAQRC